MRCLIRFLTQRPGGTVEQHDRVFEGSVVTLGRATDQVLHLKDHRVALQHARIEQKKDELRITAGTPTGMAVNNRSCREAALKTGDVIEIGANLITIIDTPAGFDFAITFELQAQARTEDVGSPWGALTLEGSGWSKRRWSWTLAMIVFAVALVIPALGLLHPGAAGLLRSTPFPDDGWWLAGPLHAMHGGANAGCEDCHRTPFVRVQDSECLTCHETERHVALASLAPTPALGETRCASCHLEHNEPPALVKTHQGLCTDCHAGLSADAPAVAFGDVSDFLLGHPEFSVSLLSPADGDDGGDDAGDAWEVQRVALSDPELTERSNLNFPHQTHLDPDGLVAPEGNRVLGCGDCHTLEPGGARFEPITMEANCSGCHTLTFDPADPSREVPHGNPETVLQALIEYYSARLLGGDTTIEGRTLLRPGQALSPVERDRAAAEAQAQAMTVAQDVIERRTCATCHQVTRVDGDNGISWQVLPVELTAAFLPHARFSHEAHDTEASPCGDCHTAVDSESSADVLMPSVETCRNCHGSAVASRNEPNQTPSTCIMCHGFHLPEKGAYP